MAVEAEQLFAEHHDALLRYLGRLTGDADLAEDVTQEAYIRLLEQAPQDQNLRAWLFRVATNLVRDRARRTRRHRDALRRSFERVPVADARDRPDEVVEREEARQIVRLALDALNEKERTMLLMREEGFTHREIAEAVGTTTKSVGTMVARALRKLASELPLDREDRS
jgi:RNA polymerase sigma factor (sigma-70 family)